MAGSGWLVFLLVSLVGVGLCAGDVYKVGDSSGWTIVGNVNYTAWASSNTFHVGDTITFVYNKQFHNVMEVTKADYRACNAGSPLSTHTSGNDSIPIKRRGHHFFICGVPGHCALGQKVDIRVPKLATAAAPPTPSKSPSPSPLSAAGGSGSGSAPSPQKNHSPGAAASTACMGWALALAMVAVGASF